MRISTQTHAVFDGMGLSNGVKAFAAAGFDTLDCSFQGGNLFATDVCMKNATQLKSFAADCGITFNQAHAAFPSYKFDDESYNAETMKRLAVNIEAATLLGADAIVVHPITKAAESRAENLERNVKFYNSLLPYVTRGKTKLALENMFWCDGRSKAIRYGACGISEIFAEMYDALDNPECFTCCLDLGHMALVGEDVCESIRTLGHDRLHALHVHDNKFTSDDHTLPYIGKNDWDGITSALGEIDYSGDFTFEADGFIQNMPVELYPFALKLMYEVGKHLSGKIEEKMNH